jgi:hypothetical protein
MTTGAIAVGFWWLFEVDSSPLIDFYAQTLALSVFWQTVNTFPRMAAHITALYFTGNVHIRSETTYVLALFAQWFIVGYLVSWLLQLSVRGPTKQSRGV